MTGTEPLDGSISDLGRRYRDGETTPAEVVRTSLGRVEGLGRDLGAVTDLVPGAEEAADHLTAELHEGRDRGPLHGVPVVVKELIDVAGLPRTAGTHVRPEGWEHPVMADAPVIAALRQAGAVIVARGRTHEFAWGITTRHPDGTGVVNPLDRALIAGGSSGGVAALVASGCVPIGIGTDTGGSVRIPAAFCGLVGWKPAFGRLSAEGVVPLAPSFDTVGVLTRTIADALVVDGAVGTGLTRSSQETPGDAGRTAILVDDTLPQPTDEIGTAVAGAVERLGTSARIEAGPHSLPTAGDLVDCFALIQRSEALAVHRDLLRTWPSQADHYGEDVAGRLRSAEQLDPRAVARAIETRNAMRTRFEAADADVVMLPTTPCPPPSIAHPDTAVIDGRVVPLRDAVMPSTIPANVIGWPALAVPLASSGSGPPPSVQLMARPGSEHLLPALADVLASQGD